MSDQSKPAFPWAKGRDLIPLPVAVMSDGELMADTQVLVDDEFRKRQCIWGKDPLAELGERQLNEPLPRPTLSEVRKAIRSFPMFTAVGNDEWEPWSWRHLSDGAIEALIDVGLAMENMMAHPRQCKLNILKLLPKPAGGYRTIGILPTLLRIWCRTRREFIRCWQITNARDYFWGDAGRGSEKAVWWESLANESCVLNGRQAVTVLLDLFKCFERVLHVIAFKNALKLQFPPLLLRWVFLSYRHPRLLQWQGAVSETAVTARGIVAGCGAAMAMLRSVMIPTLDEFSVQYASMGLKVYADDIACRYEAPELGTLLFPRMAVDQLVCDLSAHSGLGCQLGQVSGCCLTCQTRQAFRAVLGRSWCEGGCKSCVAGRGCERWAAWNQGQADGQAQAVNDSRTKVETPS